MKPNPILLDLEANKSTKKINEIGLVYKDDELKTSSLHDAGSNKTAYYNL